MKRNILFGFILSIVIMFCVSSSYSNNKGDEVNDVKNYIDSAGKDPVEYLCDKMKKNDAVVLYQFMYLKHEFDFINSLIPVLRKEGIKKLAIEYGNYQDQSEVDRLILSDNFDEELAKKIMMNFRKYGIWGYQEYMDLFKNVWKENRSISKKGDKLRIVFLSSENKSNVINDILKREIFDINEKALILLSYNSYINVNFKNKSICRIMISSPMLVKDNCNSTFLIKPFSGIIDEAISRNELTYIGFDLNDKIINKYSTNYKEEECVKFQKCIDGIIFLCNYKEYEPLTWISDFINNDNFYLAKSYLRGINSEMKVESLEYANDLCCSNNYSLIINTRKLGNLSSVQVN